VRESGDDPDLVGCVTWRRAGTQKVDGVLAARGGLSGIVDVAGPVVLECSGCPRRRRHGRALHFRVFCRRREIGWPERPPASGSVAEAATATSAPGPTTPGTGPYSGARCASTIRWAYWAGPECGLVYVPGPASSRRGAPGQRPRPAKRWDGPGSMQGECAAEERKLRGLGWPGASRPRHAGLSTAKAKARLQRAADSPPRRPARAAGRGGGLPRMARPTWSRRQQAQQWALAAAGPRSPAPAGPGQAAHKPIRIGTGAATGGEAAQRATSACLCSGLPSRASHCCQREQPSFSGNAKPSSTCSNVPANPWGIRSRAIASEPSDFPRGPQPPGLAGRGF
jgi:hypothetical protein